MCFAILLLPCLVIALLCRGLLCHVCAMFGVALLCSGAFAVRHSALLLLLFLLLLLLLVMLAFGCLVFACAFAFCFFSDLVFSAMPCLGLLSCGFA